MTGMTLLPMVVDTWWIHGDVVDTDAGMVIISMEVIIMPRMGNDNDDNLGLDDRDDTVANGGGYMVDTW